MSRQNDLLFAVIERYLFHNEQEKSGKPIISDFAGKMCEVEIWEIWALTQE